MIEPGCTAASVAAAMLHALFPDVDASMTSPHLTDFQQDAFARLTAILARYGGALLCDSVGLGKTHVAAQICTDVLRGGGSVLVTAPSPLRAHWQRHLTGAPWTWASHTTLSRSGASGRLLRRSFDLIVVDEAHAFRSAATRRYRTAARLALGARVLLLTATPVNNSLHDFENLVRLFAADDAFSDIGVPSLRGAVYAAHDGRVRELRRIAQHVMVRRTRDIVTRWATDMRTPGRTRLTFPRNEGTELITYDLRGTFADRLDDILNAIAALRFAAHGCVTAAPASELLRIGLIKRLESSQAAFAASVARLERLNATFIAAANEGRHFEARRDGHLVRATDGALQLSISAIMLPPWPARLDRTRALAVALHDRALLRVLLDSTRAAASHADHKLSTLHGLVSSLAPEDRVIVFSEYRDTAIAIWKGLERLGGVALVHGGDARLGRRRTTRRAVIERFAPAGPAGRARTEIDNARLLIATDVLAEGLNLQRARVVISYDIPWNPVRLAQRAGRIDRLGSPHERIRVLAFRPDRGLERVLGLMRRVRSKLRAIRIVGGDAPVLARDRIERLHVDAREIARIEFLRCRPVPGDGRRAVCPWPEAVAGVLCCVRFRGAAALVLLREDGHVSVDSDTAWLTLTTAFTRPGACATSAADAAAFLEAEAKAVRIAAAAPPRAAARDPVRLRAARLVRSWLRTRPGAPAAADFARADAALDVLRSSGPAGLDERIHDCVRSADPDLLIRQLASMRHAVEPRAAQPTEPEPGPAVIAAIRFRPG